MNNKEEQRVLVANTFTPLYDELEDRIRVVINYQDMVNRVDFMITRNFIINLMLSVDGYVLQHYGDEFEIEDNVVINNIEKNQTSKNQKSNLEKTDNVNLELLKIKDELLIKLDLSYQADTKNTLLVLTSKYCVTKSLLDSNMLIQLIKSIKSSIPYFKWGISKSF